MLGALCYVQTICPASCPQAELHFSPICVLFPVFEVCEQRDHPPCPGQLIQCLVLPCPPGVGDSVCCERARAPAGGRWSAGASCRRWSFRVVALSPRTRLCRDVALRVKGGLATPPASARLPNMAAAAAASTTAAPAAEKAPATVVSSGKPKADSSAAEMTRCDQLAGRSTPAALAFRVWAAHRGACTLNVPLSFEWHSLLCSPRAARTTTSIPVSSRQVAAKRAHRLHARDPCWS